MEEPTTRAAELTRRMIAAGMHRKDFHCYVDVYTGCPTAALRVEDPDYIESLVDKLVAQGCEVTRVHVGVYDAEGTLRKGARVYDHIIRLDDGVGKTLNMFT